MPKNAAHSKSLSYFGRYWSEKRRGAGKTEVELRKGLIPNQLKFLYLRGRIYIRRTWLRKAALRNVPFNQCPQGIGR